MKPVLSTLALAVLLCGCNAADDGTDDRTAIEDARDDASIGTPPPGDPGAASDQPPPPADDDAGDVGDDAEVPERFRGDWAADAAACDTRGHASRLHIGEEEIRFHESAGPIVSVAENGDELTVLARLTGEGETRDASYAFTLSGDGATLTDGNGFSRVRCR